MVHSHRCSIGVRFYAKKSNQKDAFRSHYLSVREVYRNVLIGHKQPFEIVQVLNNIDSICGESPEKYDDRVSIACILLYQFESD